MANANVTPCRISLVMWSPVLTASSPTSKANCSPACQIAPTRIDFIWLLLTAIEQTSSAGSMAKDRAWPV